MQPNNQLTWSSKIAFFLLAVIFVNPLNPYLANFYGWTGAGYRIALVIGFFLVFLLLALAQSKSSFGIWIFAIGFVTLFCFETTVGLIVGNSLSAIIVDAYSLLEFLWFFWVGLVFARQDLRLKLTADIAVIVYLMYTPLFCIYYFFNPLDFYFGAVVAGIPMPRYLDYASAFILPLLTMSRFWRLAYFRYVAILVMVFSILISFSRSIIISVVISSVLIFFSTAKNIPNKLLRFSLLFMGLLMCLHFVPYKEDKSVGELIVSRVSSNPTKDSFHEGESRRVQHYKIILQNIEDNLLTMFTGRGIGGSFYGWKGIDIQHTEYGEVTSVFSFWLWALLKTGIIGLLFFLSIAVLLIAGVILSSRQGDDIGLYSSIAALSIMALLTTFNDMLHFTLIPAVAFFSAVAMRRNYGAWPRMVLSTNMSNHKPVTY